MTNQYKQTANTPQPTSVDPQIRLLEQQVQQLTQALQIMGNKVAYLERENARRRSESNQQASYLNRKQ